MRKVSYLLVALLILSFALVGCVNTQEELKTEETSTVKVLLTDMPLNTIDKLDVYIESFGYKYSINGTSYDGTPVEINKAYDILSLAGTETSLFSIELPASAVLSQITLTVKDATVTINDQEYPVELKLNEIKIQNVDIEIGEGGELVLDFDVVRSLHVQGNLTSPEILLSPVLKPTYRRGLADNHYLIKGEVVNGTDPVSMAVVTISDDSTILRATLTDDNGVFCLGKYEDGNYTIEVYSNIDVTKDLSEYTPDATEKIIVSGEDITNIKIDISNQ
ncbi:hypothetical protein XO10_09480 [Marinitoga sp. 1135]|uniref:DUF4382 domain-containing protein n=1 Tax=unclassified Marinitoga TaxID=2640159 RepID=UPI0009506502|nr:MULTISPECIES: DUF4382 domain-containing protein [unclassified Marinitoga]APT76704.1 hypothetical protein LN42_10175 [Marinitoga sp. 1137]NUU96482.1 hypothetical protein [Marinitoga sp. 1135]NUU98401.1 hypothetical protein [Marinitoga sp. 1138]